MPTGVLPKPSQILLRERNSAMAATHNIPIVPTRPLDREGTSFPLLFHSRRHVLLTQHAAALLGLGDKVRRVGACGTIVKVKIYLDTALGVVPGLCALV